MRVKAGLFCVLVVLASAAMPVHAQVLPQVLLPAGIGIDSSFRIEYLVGSQSVQFTHLEKPVGPIQTFPWQIDPRVAVLEGTVELSPYRWFSGRLGGAYSVFQRDMEGVRPASNLHNAHVWQLQPTFKAWDAAGLLHLFSGGGYRFSFTAGYRYESWVYNGSGSSDPSLGAQASLRDEFQSDIPYFGLQTAMFFPWWKAKFEIIGSPFMAKQIKMTRDFGYDGLFVQYDATARSGGLIEFQIEGTANVSTNVLLGGFFRYSYQELHGDSRASTNISTLYPGPYRVFASDSAATFGLNLTLFY